jgi:uncharacterized membrane protein YccC
MITPQAIMDFLTQEAPIEFWRFASIHVGAVIGWALVLFQSERLRKLEKQARELRAIAAFSEQPRRKGGHQRLAQYPLVEPPK